MIKNKKLDWLTIIFYFSIFFPFVSFYPTGSDLQPIFIIMALMVALVKKITIYKHETVLIFFAICSLIYLNPFTYMVGIIRNDVVGQEFDAYIWYGAFAITIAQLIFFIIIYSLKKNRIVFWV